jgi:hypothetical protein
MLPIYCQNYFNVCWYVSTFLRLVVSTFWRFNDSTFQCFDVLAFGRFDVWAFRCFKASLEKQMSSNIFSGYHYFKKNSHFPQRAKRKINKKMQKRNTNTNTKIKDKLIETQTKERQIKRKTWGKEQTIKEQKIEVNNSEQSKANMQIETKKKKK